MNKLPSANVSMSELKNLDVLLRNNLTVMADTKVNIPAVLRIRSISQDRTLTQATLLACFDG